MSESIDSSINRSRTKFEFDAELQRIVLVIDRIPDGLTVENLEVAEDMLDEWKHSGDYRGIDVVIKLYEYLTAAASRESSR